MLALRLRAFEHFQKRPMPIWTGARPDRLRQDRLLPEALGARGEVLGRRPGADQGDVREARDPGGGAQVPRRRRCAVRLGGRLPLGPRGAQARRRVHGHGPGPEGARGHRPEALQDGRAGGGQQVLCTQYRGLVGRLVRVRSEGRRGPAPTPGLLRINGENTGWFERTLIVVDEGAKVHYIEGCTAPIYATDLAARGRGRGRRAARLEGPLHDHPELVERRLQPRHQARPCVRALDRRVGRRQHRLAEDGQVPVDLPARRGGASRGDQRRGRRQGPAPGHRRQGDPPRAEHDLPDRLEVRLEGRGSERPTAAT